MYESSGTNASSSKTPREHLFRENRFGTIVRALWPDKPALNLSQRMGCTERAANFYITGERKIPATAVAVIIAEMLN